MRELVEELETQGPKIKGEEGEEVAKEDGFSANE